MNGRRLSGSKKAFTLVELLIVIGIVAVIAAILLPVFFAARERGRRTQCLSNERQLGVAIMQYAADSNETLFVADSTWAAHASFGLGWAGRCYPYVKDVGIFRCPDDPTVDIIGNIGPANGRIMSAVSYGFNSNLAGDNVVNVPQARSIPSVTLGQITAPARTVLLFEVSNNIAAVTTPGADEQSAYGNTAQGMASSGPDGVTPDPTCPLGNSASGLVQYATGNMGGMLLNGATKDGVALPGANGSNPRHGDGANYAACDGHVVWLQPEQVSPGYDAPLPGEPHFLRDAATVADTKYALTFSSR